MCTAAQVAHSPYAGVSDCMRVMLREQFLEKTLNPHPHTACCIAGGAQPVRGRVRLHAGDAAGSSF